MKKTKKTSQQKIISFMWAKNRQLKNLFTRDNISAPVYFTDDDAEEILGWDRQRSDNTWNGICEMVERGCIGLSSASCPYCASYYCYFCGYGKRHGICDTKGVNDYALIVRAIASTPTSLSSLFSEEFYKTLVDDINTGRI